VATGETPEAWVGEQVVVDFVPQPPKPALDPVRPADASRREGQLRGVGDWGVTVLSTYDSEAPGEYQRTEFYPWTVVRAIWLAEDR
jgi:hypothetical protein